MLKIGKLYTNKIEFMFALKNTGNDYNSFITLEKNEIFLALGIEKHDFNEDIVLQLKFLYKNQICYMNLYEKNLGMFLEKEIEELKE